eukprot:gnl/Dysnectes_brevis/1721_a1957_1423.p1 GENE.gnl/Dysnectes_brevis/1721_a1957_1423~~gnl/Dysnectes_brevis/1721_a1957_1423.p1  ORF type:complete len:459 (+),score=91.89 gnl/Dysnectes_brevis/1721_a1957_1423:35-1411(+)
MAQDSGYGSEQLWGLCAGLEIDLLPICNGKEANILFAEHSDLRYLCMNTQTINTAVSAGNTLNLYIYERNPNVLARILLQLSILRQISEAEKSEQIQLAHAFLEIHGNLRIPDSALSVLKTACKEVESACQSSGPLSHVLDITGLKYKERDLVEEACSMWRKKPAPPQLEMSWEARLRSYYGDRFEVRKNLCLWDFHTRLSDRMPYVHDVYFPSFRVEGLSHLRPYFRLPQSLGAAEQPGPVAIRAATSAESRMHCAVPNPTLAGAGGAFRGDIVAGPFSSFCVRPFPSVTGPALEEITRTHSSQGSKQPVFTSVELAVLNVISAALSLGPLLSSDRTGSTETGRIVFRPITGDFERRVARTDLRARFDACFLSLEALRLLEEKIAPALRPGALCVLEMAGWVPQVPEKQLVPFQSKVCGQARAGGFSGLEECMCGIPSFNGKEERPSHLKCVFGSAK